MHIRERISLLVSSELIILIMIVMIMIIITITTQLASFEEWLRMYPQQ